MKTYTHVTVSTGTNGVVRVYGDGGLLYEVQGAYLKLDSCIDPKISMPSGEVKAKVS